MATQEHNKIILAAVAVSLLVNIFFGRWITAKISTLPLLSKFKLLSPQAPIVINQREEVRLADPGSLAEVMDKTKSKLAVISILENGNLKSLGAAVVLTTDGLFLSVKTVVAAKIQPNYFVVLSDGRALPAKILAFDPSTDLVVLKAEAGGGTAVNFGDSKNLRSGERVAVLKNSIAKQNVIYADTIVSRGQNDSFGFVFDSDRPARSFSLAQTEFESGSAIINLKGEVVGIFADGNIISSDVIRKFIDLFFNKGARSGSRSQFGFKYKMLTDAESQVLGFPQGALILEIKKNAKSPLPAQAAGLNLGDIIIEINNAQINSDNLLEEILDKYLFGDEMQIKVMRQKKNINLTLKVGEYK